MSEGESERERINRNFSELLQEMRVSQTGIQLLFGFLLAVAFTSQVQGLSHADKWVYAATVLTTTIALALNMAPVAVHRATFRRHMKDAVVRTSHVLMLGALTALFLSIMGALYLALTMVFPPVRWPLTIGSGMIFAVVWLLLPRLLRSRSNTP